MLCHRIAACAIALVLAMETSSAWAATPAQLTEAQLYVENIYKRLPGKFDYRSVRYAPTLKALIAKDDVCARRAGGVCAIDSVPFCDCQDTSADYRLLRSVVMAKGKSGARVMVEMRNFGTVRYAVDLVLSKDKWFVSDITTPSTPSLVARLQRDLK